MTVLIEENKPLLDIIRQTEAVVTKQLAAARKTAEKEIEAARQQKQAQIDQAIIVGQQEGESQRRIMLGEAEQEAQGIVSQAQHRAEALQRITQAQKEVAVHRAVAIVIGEDSLASHLADQEKQR